MKNHKKIFNNQNLAAYWIALKYDEYEKSKQGISTPIGRIRARKNDGFKTTFVRESLKNKFGFDPGNDFSVQQGVKLLSLKDVSEEDVQHLFNLCQNKNKNFPLGKAYLKKGFKSIKIETLTKEQTTKITQQLISVLVTPTKRWQERHQQALNELATILDANKLQDAINVMRSGQLINQMEAFKTISKEFQELKKGNKEAADKILTHFEEELNNKATNAPEETIRKIEPLHDLFQELKGLINEEEITANKALFQTQNMHITDIFDNNTTKCCAFAPSGVMWNNEQAALHYLEHPDIGLLQVFATNNKWQPITIYGAIIFVICKDEQGNKVLLIDSSEGNDKKISKMLGNWEKEYHEAITNLAKDLNTKTIMYNTNAYNSIPKQFNEYLEKKGLQQQTINLAVEHDDGKKYYIEAFSGGTNLTRLQGTIKGLVERL